MPCSLLFFLKSQLPLKIDIIKHPNETDGKSTAIHAKLLAPEFVNIYTYPCIPEYEEEDHEVGSLFLAIVHNESKNEL